LTRDNEPAPPKEKDFYYTDALSDAATRFVADYGRKDNPFFLYLAFTSPHWPLHAPARSSPRYKGRFDMGWELQCARRHKRMIEMAWSMRAGR
jgi:arylsulfatase